MKEMDFVDLVARDGFLDEELRHGKTFKARKQDPGTTYLKVCFLRFAHAPSPTTIDDDALSNFAFSVDFDASPLPKRPLLILLPIGGTATFSFYVVCYERNSWCIQNTRETNKDSKTSVVIPPSIIRGLLSSPISLLLARKVAPATPAYIVGAK